MSAAAVDRKHAHQVELAVEAQARLQEWKRLDAREDASRNRERRFISTVEDLASAFAHVPLLGTILRNVAGFFAQARITDAVESQEDRTIGAAITAIEELAGSLDLGAAAKA